MIIFNQPDQIGRPTQGGLLEKFKLAARKGTGVGLLAIILSVPAVSTAASIKLSSPDGVNIPAVSLQVDEFEVNTFTTGEQLRPAVAMDANGDFVVVWQSDGSNGSDTDSFSIQGQLYNQEGEPIGSQFQVNDYTVGSQSAPVVAMDSSGDFVVAWQSTTSTGTDNSSISIQARRFNSSGLGGGQFQVNTSTTGEQQYPSVAMDSDGDFALVWQSNHSGSTNVVGRNYNSNGTAQGVDFQINTYSTDSQLFPDIAMDSDGDFVVIWVSSGTSAGETDTSGLSIQGQRYMGNGVTAGDQFQVNTYTMHNQIYPSVGMDVDGDFVVVWQSNGSDEGDDSGFSIQGQRYSQNGETQGAQFQINTYTSNNQFNGAVALDNNGDFIVTWESFGSDFADTDPFSVQAQRFHNSGKRDRTEFQINEYTNGNQNRSSVAVDNDGDFVVVWESDGSFGSDTDSKSVQGHIFPKPPGVIFLPIIGHDF